MRKSLLAVMGVALLLLILGGLTSVRGAGGTYIVNSTSEPGDGSCEALSSTTDCTLREAINAANANSGADTIGFNIPKTDSGYSVGVSGTWTISLTALLPSLTDDGTTIDGSTQALNQGDSNPDGPEIEITGASLDSGGCLNIASDYNKIRGLVINRCPWQGINIYSAGNANEISGNYIGTDATATVDLGNGSAGVRITGVSQDNVIGGDTAAERNIISGNGSSGVEISLSGTVSNTISGNYIGTDSSGSTGLGNSGSGVYICNGAQSNVVGGNTAGERNIISGNGFSGVGIQDSGTMSNTISGNYIGTDFSGSLDLGNSGHGVWILFAQSNVIGGDTPGERNVISGNGTGVAVLGSGTMSNTISGNYIGTDLLGSSDLGNDSWGVGFWDGAQNNVIGGDTVGESNVIAFNGSAGVRLNGATTTGNTISENSIHSNGGLGIDLANGGNTELTAPTIALADCPSLYFGTAPSNATVELFTSPDEEGKTYLTTVSADGGGNWILWDSFTLDTYVTATATDGAGNTSEFSTQVSPGPCHQVFTSLVMKGY
ncbi:MAG: CSLREA domain-containing protein [Anaerolineae bacterium]|nr:CSLREA domain-containing protein [Anaerolineae bacterium]NIN96789.1 CSLREA domain-containing protein [Anaerolineae bacterium]NIQ79785.1 CSLREA domain-containing protein [Anaerolineae bacterium]